MDPRVPTWAPGLAGRLADAVRPILSGHYRQGLLVDGKLDHSPVTNADRESEAAIRSILSAEVPDHGVIGKSMALIVVTQNTCGRLIPWMVPARLCRESLSLVR